MNILYFTVNKHTSYVGDVEEATGWKTIYIYSIEDNIPNIIDEIEAPNEAVSEVAISDWLEDNGDDTEYEFIQL